MSESISVCGTDCGACSFFGGLCRGCNECQGRVFHAPAGCACPIYACVREKKGLRNCVQGPDLPCSLWQSTRDPSVHGRAVCREYRRARRESAEAHDESRAGGFRLCPAGAAAGSPPNPHDGRVHLLLPRADFRRRIRHGLHGQECPRRVALHAGYFRRAALRWREAYAARPDSRRFRKAPRHGAGDVGRTAGTSAEKAETLTAFGKHSGKSAKRRVKRGKKLRKPLA